VTAAETINALLYLPDDAQVTVTVRKADLVRALERRSGGPQVMTTTEAHRVLGYTRRQWQRWAEAGEIEGAWQRIRGSRPLRIRWLRRRSGRGAGSG
jgi:hypothetical protein